MDPGPGSREELTVFRTRFLHGKRKLRKIRGASWNCAFGLKQRTKLALGLGLRLGYTFARVRVKTRVKVREKKGLG